MHTLGLHVSRRVVRAVLVDEGSTVVASASADSGDALAQIGEVAAQAAGGRTVARAAIALDSPEAVDHAAVKQAFAAVQPSVEPQIVSAGAAAVSVEVWKGAAQGARHAICLWIGETVFAGLFLDGRPWTGAHGQAGSAAWLALNPVERQDYRKFGSLAAEVSDKGIARRLAWRIQAGDSSAVLERAGDLEAITATHVYEGARAGDGVSISVVRDTAKYIGMAIANLANAVDPEVVVISGPVAVYGDLLLEPVRQECVRRLAPPLVETFRCEISPLGADAVALGAARLAG
jgi:predicted NBD/HSP70 family sugar kinase